MPMSAPRPETGTSDRQRQPVGPRLDESRPAPVDEAPRLEEAAILALVDAAPDGILMVDEDGRILFANRQIEELFGFDQRGSAGTLGRRSAS